MNKPKEKTEAQKTVEKLNQRTMPVDAKEAIQKKQEYVNKPINK